MTFLVRAPPMTRSVTLIGSWDNFSKSYPMRKDGRVGPEHWTGCHSFENIICDGNAATSSQKRNGGLKMGGTYWYYVSERHLCTNVIVLTSCQYKLDDDIEFHNSAELSTTSCPMLPGQLVNVLHVPLYFSGGRQRNDSISSTSSTNRTMNPSDKYLNPRPVPLPSLPRLNTAPAPRLDPISTTSSATISPWSGLSPPSSQTSQPTSASGLRMFKVPRKASVDGLSRSISPQSRIGGLRAKFGSFKTSRAESPEDFVRGRPEEPQMELNISGPIMQHRALDNRSMKSVSNASSPASSRQPSPQPVAELEGLVVPGSYFSLRPPLAPSGDFDEAFTAVSFQQHRRQRSRSKEPSNLHRSLSLSDEGDAHEPVLNVTTLAYQPLETLKEVASAQNTPTWPVTARRIQTESPLMEENYLEKRLPTLPNTPSSAYPPSAHFNSPVKQLDRQIEPLRSHFSNSTMESYPISRDGPYPGISHFSSWTSSTQTSSLGSDYSREQSEYDADSLYDVRALSLSFSVLGSPFESKSADTLVPPGAPLQSPEQLTSTTSCYTISSTLSTSPSSPESESFEFEHISLDTKVGNFKPQPSTPVHVQAYRLPDLSPEGNDPLTCVKNTPQEPFPPHGLGFASPLKSEFEDPPVAIRQNKHDQLDSTFPHSHNMQQLLQELSYLSHMIQK